MAVNYREGKVEPSDETFKVTNLKKLNFELFEKACIACMTEPTKFRVYFNIPSSNDYILYKGKDDSQAVIRIQNRSNLLNVHCVSKNDGWIISSSIGGETQEDIIKEAWRQVCRAKTLVNKSFRKVVW